MASDLVKRLIAANEGDDLAAGGDVFYLAAERIDYLESLITPKGDDEKVFAMSMYATEKDLWKAKAEYYENLYMGQRSPEGIEWVGYMDVPCLDSFNGPTSDRKKIIRPATLEELVEWVKYLLSPELKCGVPIESELGWTLRIRQ
jgi:hypothetical protein